MLEVGFIIKYNGVLGLIYVFVCIEFELVGVLMEVNGQGGGSIGVRVLVEW